MKEYCTLECNPSPEYCGHIENCRANKPSCPDFGTDNCGTEQYDGCAITDECEEAKIQSPTPTANGEVKLKNE